MNNLALSLAVAACILVGGLAGMTLFHRLPTDHRSRETIDAVKLGAGMLSVLASLVLGLLIATAKTSHDSTDTAMRSYAAELMLLDETFRDYGDAAAVPRSLLRQFTLRLLHDYWPEEATGAGDVPAGRLLEQVREATRALAPVDAGQTWLRDQALGINVGLLRQRFLLIENAGPSVNPIVLGILVVWITFIFTTFGMSAPRNATVMVSFVISALAIGGAIFMILEMDEPLHGLMKISNWPIANALGHMPPGK
jgi:hypothetical protein